jgi:multisubunit Na+/H+ antiporter MnhG subunit
MRILAILLNILLLGEIIFILITDGIPSGHYLFIAITMILTPIISIIAIILAKGDNRLSTRKAPEEKQEIDQLRANKD